MHSDANQDNSLRILGSYRLTPALLISLFLLILI